MFRIAAASIASLAVLSGCAAMDGEAGGAPLPIERTSITYSTQPCFGTCPVYDVTIGPDGEGVFEGKRHVARIGAQRFSIDAETYARFSRHLAAVRPAEGDRTISQGEPDCGMAPTDMPGISVRWASDTGAASQELRLYLGCRSAEAERVAAVLKSAPDLLPIGQYIGRGTTGAR